MPSPIFPRRASSLEDLGKDAHDAVRLSDASRKKLIEVALPLEAINAASAREKSIRHGHPSTLHLWWARRPLATARAVIFAQMVDDPSEHVDTLLSDPAKKRAAQAGAGAAARGVAGARGGARGGRRERGPVGAGGRGGADAGGLRRRPRAGAAVRDHPAARAVGEHHQRGGAGAGARRRSGRAGARPAPTTSIIHGPRSCSTGSSCPPFTTPLPAAARCRWRRSGWGWKPMPPTSIRWRC